MLMPVLLLWFKVALHVILQWGLIFYMEKDKSECDTLRTYIATVKSFIILSYGKNVNDCEDFRRRWLSLIILVEAEQNHFKMLVICIFIQTAIKGSFEVHSM